MNIGGKRTVQRPGKATGTWAVALVACATRCAAFTALLGALALGAGCAAIRPKVSRAENLSQQQEARKKAAIRLYEQTRDEAQLAAAASSARRGDLEGCRQMLQQLLARNPKHLEARLLLAEILLDQDRAEEALGVLEPGLGDYPHDARVHHLMGLVMDALGRSDAALTHYEQAAQLDPDNAVYAASYQAELASRADGAGLSGGGERADRIGVLRLAGAEDADDVAELVRAGIEALASGSDEAAVAHFRQAQALRPHDPHISILAAVEALRADRPEVALTLLEPAAARFGPSAAIQRVLGTAYYRKGDYRSAQVAFRQALSLDNSNALSYFLMGCTLRKLGDVRAAEAHLRHAHRLDPRFPAAP